MAGRAKQKTECERRGESGEDIRVQTEGETKRIKLGTDRGVNTIHHCCSASTPPDQRLLLLNADLHLLTPFLWISLSSFFAQSVFLSVFPSLLVLALTSFSSCCLSFIQSPWVFTRMFTDLTLFSPLSLPLILCLLVLLCFRTVLMVADRHHKRLLASFLINKNFICLPCLGKNLLSFIPLFCHLQQLPTRGVLHLKLPFPCWLQKYTVVNLTRRRDTLFYSNDN